MGKRVAWKYELAGQKYNMLTVLRRAESGNWLCRCDCGNLKESGATALITGALKSCGCWGKLHRGHTIAEDITGQ
jgi:hypothetical protein